MKLAPPASQYTEGAKPTHSPWSTLASHLPLWSAEEVARLLRAGGYLTAEGKVAKSALEAGLVDSCEGKPLWRVKAVTKVLLELTRKPSEKKTSPKPVVPGAGPVPPRPAWTDLENIGTYFGVGKTKVGSWLDELGLRGYKPRQLTESGDVDMLDVANEAKEKFRAKIPTERALAEGYAQVETVEYTKKGEVRSFEKYSWHLEKVKAVLVAAGHPLDTERKMLLKGRGRNSDVAVESLDERAAKLHAEWKKLHANPKTRRDAWKLFDKKPKPLLMRVEQLMGRPRYLLDKKYLRET